ncbi:hypothetical protein [Hymenobacter koreensis]|uniref:Outer membrane protein beta-barrel domain-containing protein n=1 Tax=Hymenobacter koreensis TaxID=1084523 RepID=A0ABP8J8W3_9BACT
MRFFLIKLAGTVLWLSGTPAVAQTVLLNGNVAADTARQTFGPNRRLFRHLYVGYTAVIGPSPDGAPVRYGVSGTVLVGLRHKLRLTQSLAVGADVRYARHTYALRQTQQKVLPSAALHHRESLVWQRAESEVWLRLNAGRRGNAIGNYLDVAGWGGWVMGTAHHTDDRPGSGPARRVLTTERGLRYLNRWAYGAGARLGAGRYAVQTRYRFSDVFASNSLYPELPRWEAGLEIGLF